MPVSGSEKHADLNSPRHALLLIHDRSRTHRAHRPLRRAAKPDTSSWCASSAWAAGASGACCWSSLPGMTVRGELAKLDREHWSIPRAPGAPRQSRRRPARSAPRRLRLCAAECAGRLPVCRKTFSFRPTRSTAPCRATRCWSSSSRPRADGRRLGRIARVLERRNPTVVGMFHYAHGRSTPHQCRHSLRRAHDAAHPDSAGEELPPARKTRRRIGSWGPKPQHMQLTTISKAWSSTSRSPVGPRPRARRWAASSRCSAIRTTSASTSR